MACQYHRSWRNCGGDSARVLHRRADRGMQYHRSWRNRGGDTACAYCRVADCGPPVPQITEEIVDLITGMTGPIILRMSPR